MKKLLKPFDDAAMLLVVLIAALFDFAMRLWSYWQGVVLLGVVTGVVVWVVVWLMR